MAGLGTIKLDNDYSSLIVKNVEAIGDYEHVNTSLLEMYSKYMIDCATSAELKTKLGVPEAFVFHDCSITVNNIHELQTDFDDRDESSPSEIRDIRYNRLDNSLVRQDATGGTASLANLRSNPVGYGIVNGNLVLGFGSDEKSRVQEIMLSNSESSGINELQNILDGFVSNINFRVDAAGHIRVAVMAESPAFYLYNNYVYTRSDEVSDIYSCVLTMIPNVASWGVDPLSLPNFILEIRPQYRLAYMYITMGIVNDSLPDLETPLCAWRMPVINDLESSDMQDLIRELSQFLKIPKQAVSL